MSGPVGSPALHGRGPELELLSATVTAARTGGLQGLLLEGEAGIGKSRLLTAAGDLARTGDVITIDLHCRERDHARPFGPIRDALTGSPDGDRINALLAGPSEDPGLAFRIVDLVVEALASRSVEHPLLLTVDDLQWADPATVMALGAVVDRLADRPIAVVVATRPGIRAAADLGLGTTHVVGGLDDEAVRDLVASTSGPEPSPELLATVRRAGGNPLHLTELVSAVGDDPSLADDPDATLPVRLRQVILRQLRLGPHTEAMLRVSAILGNPFTLTDVATVTGQPTHRVVTDLAPAFTAGVLVDDETAHLTRFRHDLVRDAIEDDLPHSVRVALHRDAARRLGEAGAPPLQVAEHLTRSATPGDTEAVDWLARAAHEIAGVSPGAAVDLLGHALTLTTPTHPRSVELRVEQAGLAMWAGRLADAEQICREVLVTTEPSAAAEPAAPGTAAARLHLGQSLLGQGRVEEALAELEQVSDDEATPAQRATSHAWAATALISLTELDRAESAARAALTGADPEAEALALTALALIAASRAKPYDALELSDRALDRADASPYGRAHRYPHHLTRGHLQLEVDEFDRARATFERGLRASERLGAEWTLGSYGTALAVEAFLTGEWDTAIDSFTQGLGHSRTSGERYNEVAGHSALAVIAIHRNDLDRARTHLDDALSGVGSGTGSGWRYRGHWAGWARALVAEADGAPDRALEILQQTWDSCRRTDLAIEYPLLGPTLVRLALDQDRRDLAAEAAADVARLVDGAAPPNFRLADRHCRGLVHADAGLLVTAGSLVEHRPLARAAVAEDAARLLADAGSDRGAAVAQLRIALELYQGLGATWSMARVQARLRGLGVRSGVRGTRQRPRSGWSSLTDTERTVAELAASGLTNPQIGERLFVSRRTVQTHLSHIFVKLGMSSRTELIRATPAPPD